MTRTEVPPAPGSPFRTVHVIKDRGDGTTELVCVEQYVIVDGEKVPLPELIDAWRNR